MSLSDLSPTLATTLISDTAAQAVLRRHNVHVLGTGRPLLFCNGFNCVQQVWHLLTPALADDYQLILFDQMGVGQSDLSAYDPQQYATLDGYAQDVVAICQALQLQDVVLVGHSAGATVAMLAAIQAPEYISHTVLLNNSPHFLNKPGYYGGFEQATLHQVLTEMHANYIQWASTFATMLVGQHAAPALSQELVAYATQVDPALAAKTVELAFLGDFRAQLPFLRQPTLLLQCHDDPAVPEEVSDYMLAHLPAAKLVMLTTTGHSPHLTAPDEVATAIKDFLAKSAANE
ncbi:alpha/beta fold hydrolase [Hymenobacter sp. BT559]|uniref:alpha/beta fold hydrolase n=1 Tax=Hymenobacter sp. BT559 TaxID=2795729 RepID=UPI0018EC9865|nr:alpha/beta hydrolase [Hymenobacter sp. BT559]MBJ6145519.1 alpha/beta hydrolase [Hymenobacter sp. BT559]